MNGCVVLLLGIGAFHFPAPDDGQAANFAPSARGSYYASNQPPRRGVQQVAHSRPQSQYNPPQRGTAPDESVTPLFGTPPTSASLPPRSPKFEFEPAPKDSVPLVTPSQKRATPSQYEAGPRFGQPRLEIADDVATSSPEANESAPQSTTTPGAGTPGRVAVQNPIGQGKQSQPKAGFGTRSNAIAPKTAEAKAEKRPVAKLMSKLPLIASRSKEQEALAPTPADVTPPPPTTAMMQTPAPHMGSKVIVRPPLRPNHPIPEQSYTHSGFTPYGTPNGTPCGCGPSCNGGGGDNCCFPSVCGDGLDPCRCGDTTGCMRRHCRDCLCCCRYKCRSTCNMYPHYPYYPANHGYYYFRPYNYSHVAVQKEIALTLGEDPAAPYGHTAFDRLYADLMIETYEEPGVSEDTLNPTPRQIAPPLPDLQEVLEAR